MTDREEPKTSFPKTKIRILLLENISPKAVELFRAEGFQVEAVNKLTNEELKDRMKTIHAVGVRSKTRITKELLQDAPRLLCTGCFCIGTDQTDLEYAASVGVPVFNSPYANTRSVAELVIGEMIALARQLTERTTECHRGQWMKVSKGCYEVRGKTLGIVGYGHVGSQLSVLAESLGMKVIYYDIAPVLSLGNAQGCKSLNELLSLADFVSLHVPKTELTIGMIGMPEVKLMKKGAFFINASRGDVVVVSAIAEALRSGYLAGAAFDVYPKEPAAADESFESELRGCPNTILTPHIGGSTEEAQDAIGVDVATKIIAFINQGRTIGAVNFPEVDMRGHANAHRILNIHKNMPGFLSRINLLLADYNVTGQVLGTLNSVGYLIVETDTQASDEVKAKMAQIPGNLKLRLLY